MGSADSWQPSFSDLDFFLLCVLCVSAVNLSCGALSSGWLGLRQSHPDADCRLSAPEERRSTVWRPGAQAGVLAHTLVSWRTGWRPAPRIKRLSAVSYRLSAGGATERSAAGSPRQDAGIPRGGARRAQPRWPQPRRHGCQAADRTSPAGCRDPEGRSPKGAAPKASAAPARMPSG